MPVNSNETGHYVWPEKFSDAINSNSIYIMAGEMIVDGSIVPIGSQSRNKLWQSAGSNFIVFPTNCCLGCWNDGGSISATGSIPTGMNIIFTTKSKKHGVSYEALYFTVTSSGMYDWPFYVSSYLNENSLFLRVGEKNTDTNLITPLYSRYRNHVWLPNGCNYTYEMEYQASELLMGDAESVCHNALQALARTQPPSKATIDSWLKDFNNGRFSDIYYPQTQQAGSEVNSLYEHLRRTKSLANYMHHNFVSETDSYYTSAVSAIHFYTSQNYQASNWWDRQIGLAKLAAEIVVLLVERFSSVILNDCVAYLKQTTNTGIESAGANLADFAYIQLFWSIGGWKNTKTSSLLIDTYTASEAISSLCFPVTRHGKENGEGISVDDSYSQHNPKNGIYSQLYAGSYGTFIVK